MSPHYYNANEFARNFEGRSVLFAGLFLRVLASRYEPSANSSRAKFAEFAFCTLG
jgi:hypothetical protein